MPLSKTQIDKLGDRPKKGSCAESDLQLLDEYRRSFDEAYLAAQDKIGTRGESRSASIKTTASITEKLRRESTRLSTIQDIAGCRVIVSDALHQEQLAALMIVELPGVRVVDRREQASSGYRADHLIPDFHGKPVEIQIRTALQKLWAEVSEKFSDVLDPAIKYGGGPEECRNFLIYLSNQIGAFEKIELQTTQPLFTEPNLVRFDEQFRAVLNERRNLLSSFLNRMIQWFENPKGTYP